MTPRPTNRSIHVPLLAAGLALGTSLGCGHGGGAGGAGAGGAGGGSSSGKEWVVRFGETGQSSASFVTITPSSEVVFAGSVEGTVDFGGGLIGQPGTPPPETGFLVKLDAHGKTAWSKSTGATRVGFVGADGAGNLVVGVSTNDAFDLGGASVAADPSHDGILAKLDPSGKALWMSRFSAPGLNGLPSLAVDTDGSIVLGAFDSQATINGGSFGGAGGERALVAKLGADGKPLWYKGVGAVEETTLSVQVVVNAQHRIALFGTAAEVVDLGGGVTVGQASGGWTPFYASFDATGAMLASKAYPPMMDPGDSRRIAEDTSGGLVIAGQLATTPLDLGGGPISQGATEGQFVAKIDNTGALAWSRRYVNPSGGLFAVDVAIDANDDVLFSGTYLGEVDFGDAKTKDAEANRPSDWADGYLVKLTASGDFVWSYRCDGSGMNMVSGGSGRVALAGVFAHEAEFDVTTLTSKSDLDVFVALLAR